MMNQARKIYNALPGIVKTTLLTSEGWLVGSSIEMIVSSTDDTSLDIKDFDIIVEDQEKFHQTIKILSEIFSHQTINTFGGIKFNHPNMSFAIDIWCESLNHFISSPAKSSYIYKIQGNKLFKKL